MSFYQKAPTSHPTASRVVLGDRQLYLFSWLGIWIPLSLFFHPCRSGKNYYLECALILGYTRFSCQRIAPTLNIQEVVKGLPPPVHHKHIATSLKNYIISHPGDLKCYAMRFIPDLAKKFFLWISIQSNLKRALFIKMLNIFRISREIWVSFTNPEHSLTIGVQSPF